MDMALEGKRRNVEPIGKLLIAHTVSYQCNNFPFAPGEEIGGRSTI
jgi:hypothetical protein